MSDAPALPYDLTGLARWCVRVMVLFLILQVAYGASCVLAYVEIGALMRDENVRYYTFLGDYYVLSDMMNIAVGLGYGVIYLIALVLNGFWIYRSSANAAALVPSDERIRPQWAVGWFFVPLANLFMPFRAVKECWNSSVGNDGLLDAAPPRWIGIWWACWILGNILGQVSLRMVGGFSGSPDLEMLRSANMVDIISSPISLVAGFLFLRLIREITAAQKQSDLSEVFA